MIELFSDLKSKQPPPSAYTPWGASQIAYVKVNDEPFELFRYGCLTTIDGTYRCPVKDCKLTAVYVVQWHIGGQIFAGMCCESHFEDLKREQIEAFYRVCHSVDAALRKSVNLELTSATETREMLKRHGIKYEDYKA